MTTGLQTPPHPPEPVLLRQRRPWDRLDTWIFAVLIALTALARLVGLTYATDNGTPLFDEKHYVPQAWQVLESTRDPVSGGIEDNPGFGLIVHPPVGKQIIAIGEWIFGYNALGWRITSALAGIAVVAMLMDIARRLTRGSRIAVVIAGAYALADGVLFVSSRVGMLDMLQTLFIVGAVWALLVDQEDVEKRLHAAASGSVLGAYGPYLGYRWWRLLSGAFLGLSLGIKWSGLYYIAAFGLFSVFSDVALRSRFGARHPVLGGLVRDTAPALRDLVAAPLVIYFLSWRSWFAEETSVYRHLPSGDLDGDLTALPLFDKLPEAIRNYLHYQYNVLQFHAELTTSNGHNHPWESKPWHWLVSYRPMLYYSTDTTCAGGRECKGWIMLFGTPPIWWLLVPVVLWAAWRWIRHRDGRYAVVVTGFLASWLPWAISYDRQMYFFYATALIPFVIIGYALIAADLAGWKFREKPAGRAIVTIHAALVLAAFIFWLPIMTGIPLPTETFNLRFWLPSWS